MIQVTAAELRQGDLIYLGGTSAVLVASTETLPCGDIAVKIYNGHTVQTAPTYVYPPEHELRLSRRDVHA